MRQSGEKPGLSKQIIPIELPGARKEIPLRVLWVSLASLAVAVAGALFGPEVLSGYDAFSWLLILIPAFLFAYYRGWRATSRVIAGGTALVLAAQLAAEHLLGISVDWILLFWVALTLLAVGVGLAVVSELLQAERRQALVLAYSDILTGLPNRRLLEFMLAKEFAAAKRGRPLTLVLLTVDRFDEYRREHGRMAADEAVRRIGACLDRQMREMNIGGRYSDNQFMAILSGEKVDGAWVFADRTREAMARLVHEPGGRLTVSVGIGQYEWWMREIDELLDLATRSARRAADRGGNRVASELPEDAKVPEDLASLSLEEQQAIEEAMRRQAVEEAERRYRSLFDGVPVGIYRTTPAGRIIDANWAMVRLFGYPNRDTLLAAEASDLYADPVDREAWHRLLERETVLRDYDLHLRRYDGTTFVARTSARVVFGRGGRVNYYEGSLEDITDRKRAEENLREAKEKLQAVVDAAPVAVIVMDTDGTVQSWNFAAEKIFGWSEAEAVGRRVPYLAEDKKDEFQQLRNQVLRGEPLVGVEIRRRRRDGSTVDLDLYAAPLFGSGGQVAGIMSIMVDMTERRELELRLAQSQKMESVGQLAGGIAHDFNNLLTAILGNCELTLADLAPDDPQRPGVLDIHAAAKHAAALTRQLLAFSRRQILQPKVLNLNTVVAETLEMLGRLIGEDVEVVTQVDPELGTTLADPVEVGQVIINLAVNARDAMPEGGLLTIATENAELAADALGHAGAIPPGRYVVLSVSDTGKGMDQHTQARIFEPFFTTKEKGKGTGLGLATVYGIVKQSGGHISVRSKPGQGTSFTIYMPRLDADVEETEGTPLEPHRPTETVLLVEDEDTLRSPVAKYLTRQGYKVLQARDSNSAMQIALQHQGAIDLMVTDLVLPGVTGLELGRELSRLRPQIKILYTSGYSEAPNGQEVGVDPDLAFLQKPYELAELYRRIRELLD
ncbi:MAG: PAS domain S-box protein [Gemmatimonadota bacterium]|nr:MAG: PAS domain S-box protein [Gemmatimonadota bacterium]